MMGEALLILTIRGEKEKTVRYTLRSGTCVEKKGLPEKGWRRSAR